MKKIGIIFSSICLLAACNSTPKEEKATQGKSVVDSLMEGVMHGHDEGMGRIGRVEKAAQTISHQIDSLQKTKGEAALIASLKKAKTDLDVADSSMNKWMNTFDMEMQGMDSTAKVKYLTEQKKWVGGIADSIKTALNNAEALLNKK